MGRVDVHAIRREQILDAAERLLAHKGWAGTTFADICKEAGVSNGVLTYHFKDKDTILLALLERVSQVNADRASSLLLQELTSLSDKLALVIHRNLACEEEQREMGLLSLHLLSLATQRPEIAQRLTEHLQKSHAKIVQAIEQSQCRRDNPAAAATLMQMLLMGVAFGSLVLDLTVPVEQLMDEVVTLLHCYLEIDNEVQETK